MGLTMFFCYSLAIAAPLAFGFFLIKIVRVNYDQD